MIRSFFGGDHASRQPRDARPFSSRPLALGLLCCAASLQVAAPIAVGAEPLTVMTWNLEWFYDDEDRDNHSDLAKEKSSPSRVEWNWRRDAVAERIAKIRPTVLALQEVENRRVLWYLTRSLDREHSLQYSEIGFESRDHYTEQDVGMLFRLPAELLLSSQLAMTSRMRKGGEYYDVSKHLLAVFDFPVGDDFQRVSVLNLHLRSGNQSEAVRKRQARLVHHWVANAIKRGEHMIVLGDFNTDETGTVTRDDSDLGIALGRETADVGDDLIDLNLKLPRDQRQTHLLAGKQFDRIFCSPSLVEDDPGKADLVFRSIEVRSDLVIQGQVDTPEEHWDNYWTRPASERDLSDHYPVIATFEVR